MKTIIEILIDNSGSMGFLKDSEDEGKYLIEGETRMSLIKKILITHILPVINHSDRIIIRTFRFNNIIKANKPIAELEILKIYEDQFDKERISEIINSLIDPLSGGTPITAAINEAVTNLLHFPDSDRKIILLTDGEENGGGDYIQTVNQLGEIECKLFIIGIAQGIEAEEKTRKIATGGYLNITSKSFQINEIEKILSPLKIAVLQSSVDNISKVSMNEPLKSANRPETIQNIQNKIEELKKENGSFKFSAFDILENKVKNHILESQEILTEILSLKESLRIKTLLDTGIDATTLTIDTDYSERIKQKSEFFLFDFLCKKHGSLNVNWLNEHKESFESHDFEILDEKGKIIYLIECVGTPKNKLTFYLTSKEWNCFLANTDKYQIYRVFNVANEMSTFCLENLLNSLLEGNVVPYLLAPEILKEERVFLTIKNYHTK